MKCVLFFKVCPGYVLFSQTHLITIILACIATSFIVLILIFENVTI